MSGPLPSASRSRRRRPIVLLATGLAVALLAGCSGDADRGAATSTTRGATTTTGADRSRGTTTTAPGDAAAPTAAGDPKVGDCLEPLTYSMASAPELPATVPCERPHGGEVVAVYEFPKDAGDDYPGLTNSGTDAPDARSSCLGDDGDELGDFAEFAGDNRLESPKTGGSAAGDYEAWLVSSIEGAVFVPRPGAWTAGARWIVCAAVVRSSTTELNSYEGPARNALAPGKLAEQFGWCRTATDEQNRYDVVRCGEPHITEQLASFRVAANSADYPGDAAIGKIAEAICPKLASAATAGRTDGLSKDRFGISWTYPVADTWASGDRTGRCYVNSLGAPTTGSFAAGTSK